MAWPGLTTNPTPDAPVTTPSAPATTGSWGGLATPTDQPQATAPLKVAPAPKQQDDHPLMAPLEGGFKGTYNSARALQQALDEARKQGMHVTIRSGLRSAESQQALWDNRANNPYPVAAPGTSNHEKGFAYDLDGDLDGFEKIAEKHGFARPLKDTDPVHFTYQPEATGGERIWLDNDPRLEGAKGKQYPPASYQKLAANLAQQHGFENPDISIMMRQLQLESGFNPKAISPAGAMGIGQFMPGTLAPYLNKREKTSADYQQNGSLQTDIYFEHMDNLLKQEGGNWARALGQYNPGQVPLHDQIKNGHVNGETAGYVANILKTTPEQAQQWLLTGTGPTMLPQNKDAQMVQNRSAWRKQGEDILQLFSDMNPLTGLDVKAAQTGKSEPAVVAKDLQERLVKPALRGVTMGVLPILDWLTTPGERTRDKKWYQKDAGTAIAQGIINPLVHSASEVTKPDEEWLAPEQSQLNTWRGGTDAGSWVKGLLPGGKSKIDASSAGANLLSFGQELPSMAGALVAYEFLGPKQLAESTIGAGAGQATTWLASKAPALFQAIGPQVAHEMGSMMVGFGSQSAVQGFGDALQRGVPAKQALAEGILSGVMGATVGGVMHLGGAAAGKLFQGLKSGDLNAASAGAKDVGSAALPLLTNLQKSMGDKNNQFIQGSVRSVMGWVDKVDKMTGGEFTRKAIARMEQAHAQARELWSSQTQARLGGSLQTFSDKVMEARVQLRNYFESSLKQADALEQQLQLDTSAKAMWEQQNAVLMADPKFQQAQEVWERELAVRETMGQMGKPAVGLTPETQTALKELKFKPAEMSKLGEYMGLDYKVKNVAQQYAKLLPVKDPALPGQLAADDEIWGWLQNSVFKIGQRIEGATEDLQIDRPQKLTQMLQGADQKNAEAVVDALVSDYSDGIKNILKSGGLTTAVPQRMAAQIALVGKTLAEFNPAGSSVGRIDNALRDLGERIKFAQEVLDTEVPKAPSASTVYKGNKHLEDRFAAADREHKLTVQEIQAAKLQAQAQLEELVPQHRSLQALRSEMGETTIPERIKATQVGLSEEAFQQQLKVNDIDPNQFARLYKNLQGRNPSTIFNPDEAFSRWKNDFGNRTDIRFLKDQASQKNVRMGTNKRGKPVKIRDYKNSPLWGFKQTLRKELKAQVDPTLDPKEQTNWINQQIRAGVLNDPRSPLVPPRVHAEMRAARDSDDQFIQATLPASWLTGPQQRVSSRLKPLEGSRNYFSGEETGYREAGKAPLQRAMLFGEQNGNIEVLDGNARLSQTREEGLPVIRGLVRKSVLEAELQKRFGDVHTAIMGNPSAESAVGAARDHFTAQAENHWLNMNYDTAKEAAMDEITRALGETNAKISPSLLSYRQTQGTAVPTPWQSRFGPFLQSALEQNAALGNQLKEFIAHRTPQGVREALGRVYSVFENHYVQDNTNTQMVEQITGELGKKMDLMIRSGEVPLAEATYYRKTGKLPETFQNEFGKAVDSLQGDGQHMTTFINKYPGMQQILGASFDMMRVMEEYQVSNPELQGAFRQNYWMMRYPELQKSMNTRSGAGKLSGSHLSNEHVREIPTFEKAEELHQAAVADLHKGLWQSLSDAPVTVEGKIQRFLGMTAENQQKLLPNHTPAQMDKLAVHLGLRNPIRDPIQNMRIHLQAILRADLVRNSVQHLTNVPVAGMEGKNMVERLQFSGTPEEGGRLTAERAINPPVVPTLRTGEVARTDEMARAMGVPKGTKAAPMVPLQSLFGEGALTMAGEKVPFSQLFLHPEAAEQYQKYFNTGQFDHTYWSEVNEATRSAQLAGIGISYLGRLLANHSGMMIGMGARNILKGELNTGAQQTLVDSWSAPLNLVRMGRVAREDATMFRRAQLLGLNVKSVDDISRSLAAKLEGVLHSDVTPTISSRVVQPREGVGDAFSNLMNGSSIPGKEKFTWEELRTAHGMGVKAADLVNVGLTASKALERWGVHQPIQDAILGAHLYWENMVYEGAFAESVANGALSKPAAQRLAGQQAAEMVNRMTGTMQGYLSTNSFRNFMGNTVLGLAEITPGVLRTELHSLANAFSSKVVEPWGHKALNGLADGVPQQWFQERQRDSILGLLGGGATALTLTSLLINGHTTLQNEPGNPLSALRLRIGDKLFDAGSNFGFMARWMKAVTGVPEQGFARILTNQISGFPGAVMQLANNKDRTGNPIVVNNDPGPLGVKNVARTAEHFLKNSINLEQFFGPPDQNLGAGERVANFFGITGKPVPSPIDIAGRVKAGLAEEDRDREHQMKVWEDQLLHGNDPTKAHQAVEEIRKIAYTGPHPWDNKRLVERLQAIAATRAAHSEGGRGMAAIKAVKSIGKRAPESIPLIQQWMQNEESR